MAWCAEASNNDNLDADRLNCSKMVEQILKQELLNTLVKDVEGDFYRSYFLSSCIKSKMKRITAKLSRLIYNVYIFKTNGNSCVNGTMR